MHITDQILSIYAGTKGYLDKVPLPEVPAWERAFQEFVRNRKSDLWQTITDTQKVDDETTAKLDQALAEFQARVGFVQLDKSRLLASQRRRLADVYHQELRTSRRIRPPADADGKTCTLYSIRVPNRDALQFGRQMENRGVQVGLSYNFVLPHLPEYRPYDTSAYPNAAKAASEVVNLPFYPGLTEKEVRFIAACARACAEERE